MSVHQYPQRQRPDDQPSGGRPYEPYGAQPHQDQPYGAQPYQDQPYGAQPYQDQPYGAQPHGGEYGAGGSGRRGGRTPRPKRSRRAVWISAALAVVLLAGGGFGAWKAGWFSGDGDPVSFGKTPPPAADASTPGGGRSAKPSGDPDVQLPTGPKADFKQTGSLDDGTKIAKTRLTGAKSGFTGDVWVWAPKEYDEPKYAKSAFPVMIALPGGNGFPSNYWSDRSLGLQKAISDGVQAGTSLPFVLIMPVLNPDEKNYYDGSDIPGQPKMGTWIADDIPDFARANFRTYKSRDGWAFMGSSSGAFVGLKQVLQHPDRFKAVIASGGEIVPDSPLWKGDTQLMDENNPRKLAQKLIDTKGPEVYVNFQLGTKEKDRARMEKFQAEFGKGPVKVTIRDIQNGEHNGWHYVRGMKEGSLEWISKAMKGPKPAEG
ncbi:alpha/beta hydrolase-fold protein [Streptomyces sp. NPDC051555]|uniref:alpha/beta hydrolase n=1 Tax=Streptomyces sp. NPDC051555 TaxID=3365657 RepID=UPI003797388B